MPDPNIAASPIHPRPRRWFYFGAAVVYAGIVFWLVPPLSSDVAATLPANDNGQATVPLFNLWTVWWNADQCRHGYDGYWDAPIFFPHQNAFAFSEPQPATVAVAPVIWLTGSRVLAYKTYLWLSLFLNGFVTALILRSRKRRPATAFLAGLAMLLLPLVHEQIDVLQLIPVWGILWCWHALDRLTREPTLRRGLVTGLAVGVTFGMCVHHGLFMTLLLPVTAWAFLRNWRSDRLFIAGCVAAATAGLMVVPLVRPIHSAAAEYDFDRSPDLVARLSVHPSAYLSLPDSVVVQANLPSLSSGFDLSPGWIKLALAFFAVVGIAFRRKISRYVLFLLLTAGFAFLFSLGPHVQIGSWTPWHTLTEHVPGFAQVRSVFRFAFFAQMAVVLLAAEGVDLLLVLGRRYSSRSTLRRVASCAALTLGLLAAVETWPHQPIQAGVPDARRNADWIEYIRDNTPQGRAVICLPFVHGRKAASYDLTTRWMYYATYHGVPLVSGYSGFFPPSHFDLQDLLAEGILSQQALLELSARRVEFVVTLRSHLDRDEADAFRSPRVQLTRVLESGTKIDIYRLTVSDD